MLSRIFCHSVNFFQIFKIFCQRCSSFKSCSPRYCHEEVEKNKQITTKGECRNKTSIHSLSAFYQAHKRHQSNQRCRDLPLPRHILELFQEETKLGKRHNLSSVPWICTGLSTQMNILETPRRHVVSVVFTRLNHLNWLPLMWRSTLNMKMTKP